MPGYVWMVIVSAGAFAAAIAGYSTTGLIEPAIRWAGMVLELIGLAIVVTKLIETDRSVQRRSSIWHRLWRWFRGRRDVVVEVGTGKIKMFGFTPVVRQRSAPDATLERRVEMLDDEIGKLTAALANERDERRQQIEDGLDREQQAREQATGGLAKRLDDAAVGYLPLDWFGVAVLGLGILLSGASQEWTKLISRGG